MAEHAPCAVRDGRFVEPCISLARSFDGSPIGKGRGLYLFNMVNLKTLTPTRSFVVLRMGEHKEKGIALNVCPFCGERIDAPFCEPAALGADASTEGGVDVR